MAEGDEGQQLRDPIGELTEVLRGLLQDRQEVPGPAAEARFQVKAPTFDGEGDVEQFITQFTDVARVSGWPAEIMLLQLRESLKEKAKGCAMGADVDTVIASLRARFGMTPREARTRLQGLKREARTTLDEHAGQVERLIQVAYAELPAAYRATMAFDAFCTSLNNLGLQKYLSARQVATIEGAIEARSEYFQITNPMGMAPHTSHQVGTEHQPEEEEWSDKQREVTTSSTGGQPNELTALAKVLDGMMDRLERLEKRSQPTSRPVDKKYKEGCRRCGQEGHWKRDCPQGKKGDASGALNIQGPR